MNDEGLDYVSSSPYLMTAQKESLKDAEDIPTLEEVLTLLKSRKALYETIAALDLEDKTFSIEQQLAINKRVTFHIQELEGMVKTAIDNAKERNNARR